VHIQDRMQTITLEEHFLTQSFLKATGANENESNPAMAALLPKLLDVGAGRIAAMDEGGVDYQVLSIAAIGWESLDAATATAVARDTNDELAAAVKANPQRLGGFAALGLQDPESAARELERCVSTLGFHGALVNGTTDGKFLDDARFLPVFEAAAQLGVPVYLHPAPPPEAVREVYYSGLPGELGFMLSIAGWGWHAETALHTLRLIVSGLFDRLPELQLVIGHMGEGVPAAMVRSSGALSRAAKLQKPVAEYFQSNVHCTTSGYFTLPPLKLALEVLGIDRMMFSIDYPYSGTILGRKYLEDVSGILSAEDFAKFTHGNAERLLRLGRA